ncbi:MAG TPA: 6,7-dimethyl-8-ribityllumazine synthase [Terracidiphilus sp.]|jgi:6,7-dimethyl-8-ribityllumazine synthase|nr:6,7-dimethyl-8-ribityllumazine synthase [Terracidiphilus sp.]
MIKGVSLLRPAASRTAYDRLARFFQALGFERGRGWEDTSAAAPESSSGASFLAPLGNLELVHGSMPPFAPVAIEVTSLDAAYQAAAAWLGNEGLDPAALSSIAETHWKSHYFTVEPEPGHAFSFWAWLHPAKGKPVAVEGDLSAEGMRFAIVVARWNAVITERLLDGAIDALRRSGAARNDIEVVRVPGAWEIPAAARTLANRALTGAAPLDAIVTLGCLLRGETAHYEAIYNEVSRGIGQSQQETGIPHSFGVLTCETLEQALNRAGIKAGNKGFEAALAAIEMVSLRRKLLEERTA